MRAREILCLTAFVALGAAPGPLWAGVTVRIPPEVAVEKDEISLGDLAAIEGDETLAGRLRAVKLGRAPAPGRSQRLDSDYLRLLLRHPQIDPAKVRLIAPEGVVITRAFQILPGAALVEAASRHSLERLKELDGQGGPYALIPVSRPGDLRVPTGRVDLHARVQETPPPYIFLSATVAVRVDGRDFQTVQLNFRVARYQNVVVANHALEPNTVLGSGDFRVEPRLSTEIPEGALARILDAPDLEAVRPIRPGEIVNRGLVRPKILVRRGEPVTLLLEGRGFRITTKGQAGEDARRGDPVRVINPTSGREILGRVEGPGVVRVAFEQ